MEFKIHKNFGSAVRYSHTTEAGEKIWSAWCHPMLQKAPVSWATSWQTLDPTLKPLKLHISSKSRTEQ